RLFRPSCGWSALARHLGGGRGRNCAASQGGGAFAGPTRPPRGEPPAPKLPATIRVTEVIGRWGYAAYHKQEDRQRTEAAARSQCNHPFVIGQGPTGGVMMYLADQSELKELRVKGGPGGKNYIGLAGRTPDPPDSQITS